MSGVSDMDSFERATAIKEEIRTSDENEEDYDSSFKKFSNSYTQDMDSFECATVIKEEIRTSDENEEDNDSSLKKFLNPYSKDNSCFTVKSCAVIKEDIITSDENVEDDKDSSPKKILNPFKQDNTSIIVKSLLNKRKKTLQGMKSFELWNFLKTDVIAFCQRLGLIAKEVTCLCGEYMTVKHFEHTRRAKDYVIWGCYDTSNHPSCKNAPTMSIRSGSWFEKSRVPIKDILWIAYMWVYSYSNASMMHESRCTFMTLKDWRDSCTEACQAILGSKTDPIGGSSKLVEIFECQMASKKKPPKRIKKSADNSNWMLCGLEQFSTQLVCVFLEDKKSDTLLYTVKRYILPETTIFGYNWTSFRNMCLKDFAYLTQKHKITFFDSMTQTVLKTHNDLLKVAKRLKTTSRWCNFKYSPEYCEYVYRKSLGFSKDAYLTFLKDIAKVYVPHDKLQEESESILPD